MVISVLDQKYKCGCNKGISAIEEPSLLSKLNSIIEWNFCTFPSKKETITEKVINDSGEEVEESSTVEVEDRNFLGEEPELKPGNVFLFDEQIIAVDSNQRLVLIVSPTGYNALDRIYKEIIEVEFEQFFGGGEVNSVDWKVIEDGIIPEKFDITYSVPYHKYKIWKDKFIDGRSFVKNGLAISVTIDTNNYMFPIDLVMTDWNIRFSSEDLGGDEENPEVKFIMEVISNDLLSWFYNNYTRVKKLEK